ncbi:MAG TPA: tetratricopeptide repeat protein, partial [Pyrinomonadaceae bacterium]|nr:tetratricopeptide repeat protein [Pyrinomonadaceae bacterium]
NGRVNESTEAYRKAIQLSNDVPTMIQVAEVMQSQQRFADSEQLLRVALQTDAKNPTALFLLGRALTTKGNYAEAESFLKKGLQVSPNNFVAYTLLASLYARQSNFVEAEKSLYKALQIASPNEKMRLAQEFETIADGLMKTGNKTDAARLYKQAVSLDSKRLGLNEKLAKAQN